jgi:hypothetical protein
LKELGIEANGIFKYVSVKYKKGIAEDPISADFFIFKEFVLLSRFDNGKIRELFRIQMKNMTKLVPNRKILSLKIYDKYLLREEGLEIITESYASVLILIDEIVKSQRKIKN